MTNTMKYWLLQAYNFLGFKAAWWGCILGAGWAINWLGPVAMIAFLMSHYVLFKPTRQEIRYILILGLLGTGLDTIKASVGLIGYAGTYPGLDWLAPIWITALWAGFAATIAHSMSFLDGRPILAFILGAVFGPLSYLTAAGFGAVWFPLGDWLAMGIVALVWGATMPAIYWLSEVMGLQKNTETNTGPVGVVKK